MSLVFLNPLFLFGLSAGVLPILIHRLTQRKAILRKFSAVRLLLQSQRVVARPQRLKHLLLLALRVLAVMTLAFMVARPVLMLKGPLVLGGAGPVALILDNSLSMGYREERGERFHLAKRATEEVIRNLKGQVIIIPTAPIQVGKPRWMEPEEAVRELAAIPLSFGRGDPATALGLAYHKLKDFKVPGGIIIISDMARGDWEGFSLSKLGTIPSEAGITFLRIGGASRDSNFAIRGVRLAEGEAVVGVPARLEVTVSNLSDKSGSTLIQLYLSGLKVDQKSLELKAGEEGRAYFELFLDRPGWIDGEVRLSGDRLPLDDIFYFPLKVRERVRVLIVDGDPRRSLRASESYYLASALNPGGSEESPFLAKVITAEELAGIDLRPYQAVFLLNVARPLTSKLASFLESGRPLFIFLGDLVAPEEYNRFPLLPFRLRGVREMEASRPERVSRIDYSHDALRPFSGPSGESLRGASFHRYFIIEGGARDLLTLGNKDPLLVEADLGKGRLFLFASSADLDWNDLPLRAAYLPLIQGLLKEAVGLTKDFLPAGLKFGEPFEGARPTQVVGPRGGPGIYQVGGVRRGVNPPFEESDLGKVSDGELKKRFGAINIRVVAYEEKASGALRAGRRELWPHLLAFLLLILALEMVVANRL